MGDVMRTIKLDAALIKAICRDIADGLSNQDACYVNDITPRVFYKWLAIAQESGDKPKSRLSQHQRNCVQLFHALKKARLKRKQSRIKELQESPSAAGKIFLLKNEYPKEFNRQPYLIPNFEKLEAFMESEYTQSEIEAIRTAILAAESRRQSEIEYDEDDQFSQHTESNTES